MDLERYRPLFFAEAWERIDAIDRSLAGGPPYPPQALSEVRLQAHTLGGMAAAMSEPGLVAAAQEVEKAAGAAADAANVLEAAGRLRALLAASAAKPRQAGA